MHIVWFKRDLRLHDNAALADAIKAALEHDKCVIFLYLIEPKLWAEPDMSRRHYEFLLECLADLQRDLQALGHTLTIRVGEMVDVLKDLHLSHTITALWSHQETWNGWTYKRDLAVKDWGQSHHIPWCEPIQHGVIRRMKNRDLWAKNWHGYMLADQVPLPPQLPKPVEIESDPIPTPEELGLPPDGCAAPQKGGRTEGLWWLDGFLGDRGETYLKDISSPHKSMESGSRLSPYLAFGCLSMREVFQASERKRKTLYDIPPEHRGQWPRALKAFGGRLRWHCHFIQRLESEPESEFQNLHRGFDGLREIGAFPERLDAWKTGRTGFPMVDACMRMLIETGWVNFRMRAMLVSFASYHLWLHWRDTSLYLAQLFLDYEPGIHYSQFQMQSGTTGINAIRIYNPTKQAKDQDPEGVFIRRWIPELANMPTEFIHTPWLCPDHMGDYPESIVDEATARKSAAAKIYGRKKDPEHRRLSQAVYDKHGSRRPARKRPWSKKRAKKSKPKKLSPPPQLELPL